MRSKINFKSPQLILALLFGALFLPQIFIMNEDLGLIRAIDPDAGSIITVVFNMLKGPYEGLELGNNIHSRYYGWMYYWICLPFVALIKKISQISSTDLDNVTFLAIRFLNLFFGYLSVAVFYKLARELFQSVWLCLFLALLLVVSPMYNFYFYLIHPETLSFLLINSLMLMWIRLYKSKQPLQLLAYIWASQLLVFIFLSKTLFLVIGFILWLFYAWTFWTKNQDGKQFLKTNLLSFATMAGTTLLFYPKIFNSPLSFIKSQLFSVNFQLSGDTFYASLEKWIKVLTENPYFLLFFATLLGSKILIREIAGIKKMFLKFSIISILTFGSLLLFVVRILHQHHYFAILVPVLVIYFGIIFEHMSERLLVRKFNKLLLILAAIMAIAFPLHITVQDTMMRFKYKSTPVFQTFSYLQNAFSTETRIAHDFISPVPSRYKSICHEWYLCFKTDLNTFMPEVVIFNEFPYLGANLTEQVQGFKDYVIANNFKRIATFEGTQLDIFSETVKISIFIKPTTAGGFKE